jgi:16S rRNA (uracil1498-N3)-methyltransferase
VNLVLLIEDDFIGEGRVRLTGRRLEHVRTVHRARAGDELVVGVLNGRIGRGVVESIDDTALQMSVTLDRDPPAALDVTLVIAVPRPKVLNRVIAASTSLGVKRMYLINAWRVEKSYWKSPRMSDANLHAQCVLGLEQARDTVMPSISTRRLFRPFVENELPGIIAGSRALVAHPYAQSTLPALAGPITLAIGPEGGFIEAEIASLEKIGFQPVSMGPRILRVETAVAALMGKLT